VPAWTIPQGTTAAPAEPSAAWEDVMLLLHMDGANGSIVFTDSSSHARTITRYSGATIRTAVSKFGGACGEFSGLSSGYITAPASADWGAHQDFTLEMWVRPEWNARKEYLASTVDSGNTHNGWALYKAASGAIGFSWWDSSDTLATGETTTTLTVGAFAHVAVTVAGTTVRIYIDGNLEKTDTHSVRPSSASRLLQIGRWFSGTGSPYFYGYLDDSRFTAGFALYTGASFSVPTAAYPNS